MKILFIMCWLLIPISGWGQIHFERYSADNGLSQNSVMSIIQDKRGYLWFGTEDGLNRFDGFSFQKYLSNPGDSIGLYNDQVWSLIEGPSGKIWIGHANGVSFFGPETYSFSNVVIDESLFVTSSYLDSKGHIWFGCTGAGLLRVNATTFEIEKFFNSEPTPMQFDASTWEVAANYITSIIEHDQALWVGTRGAGLWEFREGKFDRITTEHSNSPFFRTNVVWSMIKDAQGNLYCATLKGLAVLELHTNSFKIYESAPAPYGPGTSPLTRLCVDKKGAGMWIATYGEGLFYLDFFSNSFTNYSHNAMDKNSLSGNLTYSLLLDRTDNLWIGTWGGGLNKLSRNARLFSKYDRSSGLKDNFITGIDKQTDSSIIVSTYTGGIYRGDRLKGKDGFKFSSLVQERKLTVDYINALHLGKRNLYVGLDGGGVAYIDKEMNAQDWKYYSKIPSNPNSLNHQLVRSITEDRFENVWVGTWGGGLKRISSKVPYGSAGSLQNFEADQENSNGLQGSKISVIYIDKNDYLWVGTESGLSRSRLQISSELMANEFVHFGNSFITTIVEHNETLWAGTDHGLFKLEGEILIPETHFGNNVINAVIFDEEETMWVTTNNGLLGLRKDLSIVKFSNSDGLQGNEFNVQAGVLAGNQIIVGGINGLNSFNPYTISKVNVPGSVAVTKVTIDNEIVFNDPGSITLESSDKTIEFEFTSFDYSNTQLDQFEYQLAGFDSRWISSSASRVATYTNLDAGNYAFQVRMRDAADSSIFALPLTVNPPLWGTWYAYMAYVFLSVSLIYFARKSIVNRERLKAKLSMEHLELTKLKELDDFKSKLFENISHEFRTPLTLIQGYAGELLERHKEESRALHSILQNSHSALSLVNQLLDLSKLDEGKLNLEIYSVKICEFLRMQVQNFESRAHIKEVILKADYPSEETTLYIDPSFIEKILSNLISNAIKYSRPGDLIKINAQVIEQRLKVEVSDTGIGISKEDLSKVFDRFFRATEQQEGTGIGLSLTKELVSLHKGTLTVESILAVGSTFVVEIPGARSDYPEFDRPIERYDLIFERSAPTQASNLSRVIRPEGAPILLIVEDNEELGSYLARNLESEYDVLLAKNGNDGLVKSNLTIPDIILSDWMMPGMSGAELCKELKSAEVTSHIPIVLLTAKADIDSKLMGLETGADDYLTKPFEMRELKARLRNLILQRQKLKEKFANAGWDGYKQAKVSSVDKQFLDRLYDTIDLNISNSDMNVEWLSRKMGVSRVQLHRKLRALVGLAASDLIRDYKLKRAADLLRQHAGNVSEVAFKVGFENLSYFTKVFKQKYQVTPSEFVNT